MAEDARMRDRAEAADHFADAAHMRSETAMHGDAAHAVVGTLAGEVTRRLLDHARRKDALAVERAARSQHLIERGHRTCRGEAAPRRHAGAAESGGVLRRDQDRA